MQTNIKTNYQLDALKKLGFLVDTNLTYVTCLEVNNIPITAEMNDVIQRKWSFIIWDPKDPEGGFRLTGNELAYLAQEAFDYLVRDPADPITVNIMDAINELEELGGPEADDYIKLMESIESECRTRKLVAAKNYINDAGYYIPDGEGEVMTLFKRLSEGDLKSTYSNDVSIDLSPKSM